jgi:hypothetical protein
MWRTARVAGQVGADYRRLDRLGTIGLPGTLVHQAPHAYPDPA